MAVVVDVDCTTWPDVNQHASDDVRMFLRFVQECSLAWAATELPLAIHCR